MKLFLVIQMLQERRMMTSMKNEVASYFFKCLKAAKGDQDAYDKNINRTPAS